MGTGDAANSGGWATRSGQNLLAAPDAQNHIVQFYDDAHRLSYVVADFLAAGLRAGEPVVVVASAPHRETFRARLEEQGLEVDGALASGQLTLLDARETLASFLVNGLPDRGLFLSHMGPALERLVARWPHRRIRAYGEMVNLLWDDGQRAAAIQLEELWNELGRRYDFSLLCAYVMGNFYRESDREHFQHLCATHTHVLPTEAHVDAEDPVERLRQVSLLQQRTLALEMELRDRQQLEQALRDALRERQRAEEALRHSQQELQDFVDNAAEGLHWVGADGRILWANKAELELLGYSREEYVGRHIAEFHADADVIADILARLGRNETLRDCEARLKAKDGSIKHVLINSNVYRRDGEFIHTRCFSRDVTARKQAEEERRLRSDFEQLLVGVVSHDLRNPISAITMSAALARARTTDERVAKALSRITSSADRAQRIIGDLLDLTQARLGGGIPVQPRLTHLQDVIHEVVEEHQAAHPEREFQVHHDGDTLGEWDGDRLAQALANLVSNAIHYSPADTPIQVRTRRSAGEVSFSVHNQGAPIPEAVQPHLFEPFKRGRLEGSSKSLGLGLYIVERIVSAHGGRIECRSTQAEGTTFTVRLPVS